MAIHYLAFTQIRKILARICASRTVQSEKFSVTWIPLPNQQKKGWTKSSKVIADQNVVATHTENFSGAELRELSVASFDNDPWNLRKLWKSVLSTLLNTVWSDHCQVTPKVSWKSSLSRTWTQFFHQVRPRASPKISAIAQPSSDLQTTSSICRQCPLWKKANRFFTDQFISIASITVFLVKQLTT